MESCLHRASNDAINFVVFHLNKYSGLVIKQDANVVND